MSRQKKCRHCKHTFEDNTKQNNKIYCNIQCYRDYINQKNLKRKEEINRYISNKIDNLLHNGYKNHPTIENLYVNIEGDCWSYVEYHINEKSSLTRKLLNLKWGYNNHGYLQASVRRNNESITLLKHRVIMETFNPRKETDGHEIDHIDRDKENNDISNLRWATREMNMNNKGPILSKGLKKPK